MRGRGTIRAGGTRCAGVFSSGNEKALALTLDQLILIAQHATDRIR
jgi:hypothetical protein